MHTVADPATPGHGAQTRYEFSLRERMVTARRWLLWQSVPEPGKDKPRKVPHYVNGQRRHGKLDTPEDWAQLAAYHEAKEALESRGADWGLGFALGADGSGAHWQGIDFDGVVQNRLADLANDVQGYVEVSPSERGAHALGYGQAFVALGSNGSGIEAYAAARFFTVTERMIRDGVAVDLAPFVEQVLVPRHATVRVAATSPSAVVEVSVGPKTVTELRSALAHLRSDDRQLWVRIGMALKELGETGRGLWVEWSQSSEKYDPKDATRTWGSFQPSATGHRAVFAEAQRQGWVNPMSNAAKVPAAAPMAATSDRALTGRTLGGVAMRSVDWLWTGWIPKGYITIFAGESGAGKSTVLADIAARVTTGAAWPGPHGIPGDKREPGRVLWLGSEDSIEEMTIPRLTACGANLNNVIEIQGVMQNGKRNTFSMQDDIVEVARWLTIARSEGLPFAMLVIDPVTSYLPGQRLRKVDINDGGQLRTILEPWLILAQEHGIAVVCVTHFGKDTSRSMLHRVLGSAAFAQTCRSLCTVIEPPTTDEYAPGPFERVLMQVKGNLAEATGGAWKFSTERVEVGADPRNGKPIYATRPDWDELDTALTPTSVVGRSRGPKSQHALPFGNWLKAKFANLDPGTWVDVGEVMRSAMSDGACPSESWWNKHSSEYLEKQNHAGPWMCRPKTAP